MMSVGIANDPLSIYQEDPRHLQRIAFRQALHMTVKRRLEAACKEVRGQKLMRARSREAVSAISDAFGIAETDKDGGVRSVMTKSVGLGRFRQGHKADPGAHSPKFTHCFAKLSHLLTTKGSSEVAQEDQQRRPLSPQFGQGDLRAVARSRHDHIRRLFTHLRMLLLLRPCLHNAPEPISDPCVEWACPDCL